MAQSSVYFDSRFGDLNGAQSHQMSDIEIEKAKDLERDFVPCSKCCPQVNQTVVLVAVAWILISVLLSLVNQWIFHNHMRFAFFLILIGLLSTFLGSLLCFLLTGRTIDTSQVSKYWRMLLLFSFLHALGLSFSNLSSQSAGLTLNQIVKSALPLVTLIASWYFEGQEFTKRMIWVTIFLVFSALLALYKNPEFGVWGFICAIGALLCQTFETIVVSMLLKRTSFTVLDLALITSIPSAMMVSIPFYVFEFDGVVQNTAERTTFTITLLLASSILAFLSYIVHFSLIWYTSSLYSVIIGHLKIVILLLSSMVVFGTPLVTVNYVGIALVIAGFVALNIIKFVELRVDNPPVLSFNESPAISMDMLESKDRSFSQPRND